MRLPDFESVKKEVTKRRLMKSMLDFTKYFFPIQNGQQFEVGKYHEVLTGTLDKVFNGEIRRLIINMPPGYSKTETAVVNFVAKGFAVNPKARFIHVSYGEPLALDNSTRIRELISLPEYQDFWHLPLKRDTTAKGLWRTDQGGHLRAAAAGKPITGFRAGRIMPDDAPWEFTGALIIDDPIKPDDVYSEVTRKFINDRWHNTLKSRLADDATVPVILIMQRLHVDDFTAALLESSGEYWHVLQLPILIDGEVEPISDHAIMIKHGLPKGPLWSKKHNEDQIELLKKNAFVYSSQYAQSPIVIGGNLFKSDWLQTCEDPPKILWRAIYGDTAQKTKERNDYTVLEEWGYGSDGRAYLLDLIRERLEAPDLETVALAFWGKAQKRDTAKYGVCREIVIEDKVSGTGLIQSLRKQRLPVRGLQRERDKYTRALDVAPFAATGLIVLPAVAHWKDTFVNELTAFPDGKFDDQVDPLIDALTDMYILPNGGALAGRYQNA